MQDTIRPWTWLLKHGEAHWETFNDRQRAASTTAARLFSSGTTGLPKALDISHYNLVAQHALVFEHDASKRDYEPRRLLCNPMFHVSIAPRAHTSPLRSGVVTVVMRRFHLSDWLRYLQKYHISEVNMVPPMVHSVLTHARTSETAKEEVAQKLKSTRFMWCGAAPLSREAQIEMKTLLSPEVPFNQVWGMSETTCIATMIKYPEYDPTGSSGRLLPNLDAKLVDDEGNEVNDYTIAGELCIRGPIIVNGYFRNEEATKESWDTEGYFHTGDIAKFDPQRELWFIVDRKKVLKTSHSCSDSLD
jgi:4-coumarate--CoA ligase